MGSRRRWASECTLASKEKPKTLADHAKGIAALPGEKLAELKAFGAGKIDQTMAAFLGALPALRQAGFVLREYEVEFGITPRIIAHFAPAPASEADVAAAREALKDNKMGASMLGVLTRAGDAHRRFKASGFSCALMEIDVGVLPAVRLRYRAEDVA
jgi:hypothetical protein